MKREFHGHKHLMTSHVIRVGKAGRNRAWELSWGKAMFPTEEHPYRYGVSVVDVHENGQTYRTPGASGSFPTKEAAEEYIKSLK